MCAVVTSLSAATPACQQTRLPCIWNLDFGKLFAGQEIHSRNTPHRPAYFFGKRLRYFWYLIKTWSWNILNCFQEHKVTNFIHFSHDSIDIFRMFLHHQDSAVPAANTKGIAGKSSRYTRPHILSHSTVKDSAFRLILSSQSFQSQASENSPTASRDFGKKERTSF